MNKRRIGLRFVYGAFVPAAMLVAMVATCYMPSDDRRGAIDSQGHYVQHRSDDYVRTYQPWLEMPRFVHISRTSVSGGEDEIIYTGVVHGGIRSFITTETDMNPPRGLISAFVQGVRDRRTEFYSEMGWADPNPKWQR